MKRSKKMIVRPAKKSPFEALGERRRQRTFLLRLNDEEMNMLDELASLRNISRSNVMRMLLQRVAGDSAGTADRERSESEITREAERRAVIDRVEDLRKELLARVRVKD